MSSPKPPRNHLLKKQWFHLDDAAKIYLLVSTAKWSALLRVAAVLKRKINPALLQKAADAVLPRFPIMNAQVRSGIFCYRLKENPKRLIVKPDKGFPCAPIKWRRKHAHLLRILYTDKRIAVEFFHAVTDGSGAMVFLKTLVAEYLRLCGINIPCKEGILDLKKGPQKEEMVDAFKEMPLPKAKKARTQGTAYHFSRGQKNAQTKRLITYIVLAKEIQNKAKAIGVSVTQYLTAALLYISYKKQTEDNPNKKLPVRVTVPVDMRQFFPTQAVRNCSWFIQPEIIPPFDNLTFESIASNVHQFMKEALVPEKLYADIAPNASLGKSLCIRLTPLLIKKLIIRAIYKARANTSATTSLSNLGIFKGPKEMMSHIEGAEFMLGPSKAASVLVTVLTTNETMRITFTSNQEDPILPEGLENFFSQQNIIAKKEVISE
ncbi:MAG: hypothetical protein GX813_02440 [Erysipelotrichia bacterium]|nr:hypothetical protein [Erysipelotrichia bacterium]